MECSVAISAKQKAVILTGRKVHQLPPRLKRQISPDTSSLDHRTILLLCWEDTSLRYRKCWKEIE